MSQLAKHARIAAWVLWVMASILGAAILWPIIFDPYMAMSWWVVPPTACVAWWYVWAWKYHLIYRRETGR